MFMLIKCMNDPLLTSPTTQDVVYRDDSAATFERVTKSVLLNGP